MAHTPDPRGISPIKQRALDEEAYFLHVEEMLTTAEVAKRQGVSQGTAVRRCQRAERRLAALFAEDVRTLRFRQEQRYEALLSRVWQDYEADRTPKRVQTVLAVLDRIDRLWGLDRNPPIEQAPTVFAQHATVHQLPTREKCIGLLGKDPGPAFPSEADLHHSPQPLTESPLGVDPVPCS